MVLIPLTVYSSSARFSITAEALFTIGIGFLGLWCKLSVAELRGATLAGNVRSADSKVERALNTLFGRNTGFRIDVADFQITCICDDSQGATLSTLEWTFFFCVSAGS